MSALSVFFSGVGLNVGPVISGCDRSCEFLLTSGSGHCGCGWCDCRVPSIDWGETIRRWRADPGELDWIGKPASDGLADSKRADSSESFVKHELWALVSPIVVRKGFWPSGWDIALLGLWSTSLSSFASTLIPTTLMRIWRTVEIRSFTFLQKYTLKERTPISQHQIIVTHLVMSCLQFL